MIDFTNSVKEMSKAIKLLNPIAKNKRYSSILSESFNRIINYKLKL